MEKLAKSFPLMIFILLTNCARMSVLPSATLVKATPSSTHLHVTPSPIANSTQTPMIEPGERMVTNTASPIVTITVTPYESKTEVSLNPFDKRLKIQCLDIAPTPLPDLFSTGFLILDHLAGAEDGTIRRGTYLLDMTTWALSQFSQSNERLTNFAVSPDRKWIAYIKSLYDETGEKRIGRNLAVTTVVKQNLIDIPWDTNWGYINTLLDKDRLVLSLNLKGDENPVRSSSTFLVLNPFTGEQQVLKPDYPNIYNFPPIPHWAGWGETAYDPTLSRVVYLRGGENGWYPPIDYVLWDLKEQRDLASFTIVGDLEAIPRWSPDGSQFVFAPSLLTADVQKHWPAYELYIVDKEGKATPLTDLKAHYPWIYISDYSWSPDGKQIAFWFSHWEDESPGLFFNYKSSLAIVDTTDGTVTSYCIPGDFNASFGIRRIPPPLWSPDGKQLVVQNLYSEEHSRLILIDISQNLAVQIAEDMDPVGWMIK